MFYNLQEIKYYCTQNSRYLPFCDMMYFVPTWSLFAGPVTYNYYYCISHLFNNHFTQAIIHEMPSWHIASNALIIFATKSIPLLAILYIISFLYFWRKLIICKPLCYFILLAFRQMIAICMYMNSLAWLLHNNERN